MEELSKSHPLHSNIHELMRWRNRSAPLQNLSLFPLTYVSSKNLLSESDPGEAIHFHLNQLFQITCSCCIYKENYTFFLLDLRRDSYLENIYLSLSAAVIGFTASFSPGKRNSCKLLTLFKVSCGARRRGT